MAGPDAVLGFHADALQFHRQRLEVLAANIANADTPGYLARDLDFSAVLAAAQQPSAPARTQSSHLCAGTDLPAAAHVYRVPSQPSADGNTVELHQEQARFAEAAVHYRASLSFVDSRVRSLLTAITGQ
jgi:flagellar basal-body rod protein FlgB